MTQGLLYNVYSSIHNINYIIIIIMISGYIICVDLKSLGAGLAVRSQVWRHETCDSDRIVEVRVNDTMLRLPAVKKPSSMARGSLTDRMLMKRQPVPNGRILHNKSDIREGMADWRWEG